MNNVETQSDQNYTGKGYILKSYKGPRELYNYLWSLTENIEFYGSEEENKQGRKYYHHFITHIYASTLLKSLKADDFNELLSVPVYCRLIEQKFKRRIDIQLLKKMNIYKIIPHRHSMVNGKCREYILNPNIFSKAQSIVFKHIIDEWKSFFMNSKYPQNVNLFRLTIHRAMTLDETGKEKEDRTKNQHSRRTITLLPVMRDIFEDQLKICTDLSSEHLFCTPAGYRVQRDHLRGRVWKPALAKAGIIYRPMMQTRHSFATTALSLGENPLWISKVMGHSTTRMVIDVYAKYIENQNGTPDGGKFNQVYEEQ